MTTASKFCTCICFFYKFISKLIYCKRLYELWWFTSFIFCMVSTIFPQNLSHVACQGHHQKVISLVAVVHNIPCWFVLIRRPASLNLRSTINIRPQAMNNISLDFSIANEIAFKISDGNNSFQQWQWWNENDFIKNIPNIYAKYVVLSNKCHHNHQAIKWNGWR